jgi:hypothetical protein
MTLFKRVIAAILLCVATAPAFADQGQPSGAAASEAEMLKWKKDVLDRYKHVDYLDSENSPISEGDFIRALRERHAAFSMTHDQGSFERIVVRLMSPEEAAREHAQMNAPQASK